MTKLIHADETHALLGACFEVYKEKGCGFLEAVFQECLELELTDRRILFKAQAPLHNYLKATGCRVGLLVNFGHHPLVEHERIVL